MLEIRLFIHIFNQIGEILSGEILAGEILSLGRFWRGDFVRGDFGWGDFVLAPSKSGQRTTTPLGNISSGGRSHVGPATIDPDWDMHHAVGSRTLYKVVLMGLFLAFHTGNWHTWTGIISCFPQQLHEIAIREREKDQKKLGQGERETKTCREWAITLNR